MGWPHRWHGLPSCLNLLRSLVRALPLFAYFVPAMLPPIVWP